MIKKILSFPTVRLLSEMGTITELPGQRLGEFIIKTNGKKGEFESLFQDLLGLAGQSFFFGVFTHPVLFRK